MDSEQDQDGWNDTKNTFPSTGTYNSGNYSMKTWGDEENLEEPEEMQRKWAAEEQRGLRTHSTILHGSLLYLCHSPRR
jgi:hypothetical protein